VAAQEERPQITPGERPVPRKKDAEPRAVAVLQLGAKGKASLVPIAILVNGKFWDASAYKADPVPMALDSGVVYEVEQTGSSQGLFTVGSALHSNAANAPMPWLGTGAWVPAGTEKTDTEHKAAAVPVGMNTDDGPPRLTRTPGSPTPASAPAKGSTGSAPSSSSGPRSDDGPPRLSKPANESSAPAPTSAPSSNPPKGDAKGSSTPTPSDQSGPGPKDSPADKKVADAPVIPMSDSGTAEANRPRLRRGRPAESFADDDIPGYSKPGTSPAKSDAKAGTAAAPAPVQLIPAISDAAGPPPHSYVFQWLKDEEGERRKQMQDLARQQLRAYVEAQARARITPETQTTRSTHRAPAKKPPDAVFENEKMVAYDLWNTNQPVIIFSADAHMPPPAPGAQGGVETDRQYSITLVAYPDIYNGLHKIYSGVTDQFHLDITPRLELVDAVDADGDNRGELLFRETSDAGSGWIIYRATADKLWKMYDSLNPE
jgi:hypothetical protein